MTRRVQIVVSSKPAAGPQVIAPRLGFLQRFKLLITGIAIAAVAVALLIVAVVLGSILAALVLLAVAAAIVVLVVRASLKRGRQ
jgi:hypothetical protein